MSEGILVLVYANHKSEYGPFFKIQRYFYINQHPAFTKQTIGNVLRQFTADFVFVLLWLKTLYVSVASRENGPANIRQTPSINRQR
jgi:hypothetical protein